MPGIWGDDIAHPAGQYCFLLSFLWLSTDFCSVLMFLSPFPEYATPEVKKRHQACVLSTYLLPVWSPIASVWCEGWKAAGVRGGKQGSVQELATVHLPVTGNFNEAKIKVFSNVSTTCLSFLHLQSVKLTMYLRNEHRWSSCPKLMHPHPWSVLQTGYNWI